MPHALIVLSSFTRSFNNKVPEKPTRLTDIISVYIISNVGWSSFAAVMGFWVLRDNIYECACCHNRYHGMAIT
jgi:hypothetical protein